MKISTLAISAGMLLVTAAPAFARGSYMVPTVTNTANVISASVALSATGGNTINSNGMSRGFSRKVGSNTIVSGTADSMSLSGVSALNTNGFSKFKVTNTANVVSLAGAGSLTGGNTINSNSTSKNYIETGAASSGAQSTVSNVNVTGFGM